MARIKGEDPILSINDETCFQNRQSITSISLGNLEESYLACNGKSSAKCIPSPRYSPYANDDAVCSNLFYPNSCTVYSLKLYTHVNVCMHTESQRCTVVWNRFTPVDSLIPRRERQNTVRGYICSVQAAGNRSWKSCKK